VGIQDTSESKTKIPALMEPALKYVLEMEAE
jgi:hypothetical protein